MQFLFLFMITLCTLLTNFSAFSQYDFVICAIFQNEELFLREWIEHHKSIGVQHFYLYNNLSTDSYLKILEDYVKCGDVDLWDWPVQTNSQEEYLKLLQIPAYQHALEIVKEKAAWAAFIDIDEFLVPHISDNIVDLMDRYKDYGGLVVNWQVFGTSGHKELENIRENLIYKGEVGLEMNKIVKLIVNPKRVQDITDPHFFQFKEGFYAVNSNGEEVVHNSRVHPVVIDTIQINHYWFGPENWFINNKLARRAKWGIYIPNECINDLIDSFNLIKDQSIIRFTVTDTKCYTSA